MDPANFPYTRRLLACLFILFGIRGLNAQSLGHLVSRKIDEQNGLSDNSVQCIYKDHRNFVWIGTASGLNEMNGSSLTIFRKESSPRGSLSNNDIKSILPARGGMLWIATMGGLNIFDPVADTFSIVPLRKGEDPEKEEIEDLASSPSGDLYIATLNGLFRIREGTRQADRIALPGTPHQDILENNSITGLYLDSTGTLWITTYNGLWSYGTSSHRIRHEIDADNDPDYDPLLTAVCMDHHGNIWCSSWRTQLKLFQPATGKVTDVPFLFNSQVSRICEVRQPGGNYILWFNGKNEAFDPSTFKVVDIRKTLGLPTPITVLSIYVSPDRWLWVGTDQGLEFYDMSKSPFQTHIFPSMITSQTVVLSQHKESLLVGGSGKNFLKAFDSSLHEVADYGNLMPNSSLSCLSGQVRANHLFVAGTSEGIVSLDLSSRKVSYNPLLFLKKKEPSANFISCLFKDRDGSWWIFPWRFGIWKADSLMDHLHPVFTHFLVENGDPKPLVVASAIEDPRGNLWMADLDEGIILFEKKTGTFSKPFQKELGVKYQAAQVLYYRGSCYSFTGNTLLTWKTTPQANLEKIQLPPQMDKPIASIALDSTGRLWIATYKGLLVYDFHTRMFKRFSTADGLLSNHMDGTLFCMENGKMVFGAPTYLLSFFPQDMIASVDRPADLHLVEMLVNGKRVGLDPSHKMIFDHEDNNFNFKWAVTDYNNPLNNHYYYQLEGIDTGWHYNGNRGEVNFANLSPGDYTLLLKGTSSNEVPASRILSLHFEIRAPFYRTGWFFASIFLFLAGLFYLLYRYRLAQGLKLEKLRNKISYDLHDEIGSTLSSISILSEMALHQAVPAGKTEMLEEIKENSISLMERMDDIVWSINPKHDSMESLLLRIKAFAGKLFEAKEINYQMDMDPSLRTVTIPMENRQHIYLIMKEAINNLVKYSHCTQAAIRVRLEGNLFEVQVTDNGKGFTRDPDAHGNGIRSMEKRAADMHAEFHIDSVPGQGTRVMLTVKIK